MLGDISICDIDVISFVELVLTSLCVFCYLPVFHFILCIVVRVASYFFRNMTGVLPDTSPDLKYVLSMPPLKHVHNSDTSNIFLCEHLS